MSTAEATVHGPTSSAEVKPPTRAWAPRTEFPDYNVPLANFHGHHRKALHSMHQKAVQVDLVLELRDARAPLSSINVLFDRILGHKQKLVLYTKNDLSSVKSSAFAALHPNLKHLNIDCRSSADAKAVLQIAKDMYNEMTPKPPLGLRLLVTGMPNAGKSTFLNTLRKTGTGVPSKVAPTGETPGVTRSVSETICISRDPNIYIFDTPGVFVPQVKSSEAMLKMCLISAVKRSVVDPVVLADYLLYRINLQYPDGKPYLRHTGGKPTNNIEHLLRSMAKTKATKHGGKFAASSFNENSTALQWIDTWAKGKVAKLVLDDLSQPDAYAQAVAEQQRHLASFDLGPLKVNHREKRKLLLK